MPRPKPSKEDLQERKKLAAAVKQFAKDNLFTEIKLAEVLGLSRRTVQMIKAAKVTPHPSTLHSINGLFAKYKAAKIV